MASGQGSDSEAAAGDETSSDGVFEVGDVRSGSTKRIVAAVGEGMFSPFKSAAEVLKKMLDRNQPRRVI